MMEYKSYMGHVEFDDQAGIFHGTVVNMRDVVTFQGESVEQIRRAFKESIDDYLEFCAERGEAPEKPYSGKFVVRVEPELHKKVALYAKKDRKSLNAWVNEALEEAAEYRANEPKARVTILDK